MSKYIATRAVRGANALVYEAETMLHTALAERVRKQWLSSPIPLITCPWFMP